VLLVTYLPFHRIHEVGEYFLRNVQLIGPSEAIAYVDNVFRDEQRDILVRALSDAGVEVRMGNWRSRDVTWFQMLADLQGSEDLLFVDSDSVADEHFHEIHRQMEERGMHGLLDREGWVRGGGTGNAFARCSRLLGYISIDGGRGALLRAPHLPSVAAPQGQRLLHRPEAAGVLQARSGKLT